MCFPPRNSRTDSLHCPECVHCRKHAFRHYFCDFDGVGTHVLATCPMAEKIHDPTRPCAQCRYFFNQGGIRICRLHGLDKEPDDHCLEFVLPSDDLI